MDIKLGRSYSGRNKGWNCLRRGCYLGLRGTRWQGLQKTASWAILFGPLNQEEWDGPGMCHVWETEEVHRGIWWWDVIDSDHLQNIGVAGRTILKRICRKYSWNEDWIHMPLDGHKLQVL